MRKLQSFYVFKFDSERLKEVGYNLTTSLSEARINGEVVSLGENEVIRSLFRLKGKEFNPDSFNELLLTKKKLKRRKDSQATRDTLAGVEQEIDNILFVPEIISIKFSNKAHYKRIAEKGLFINGKEFVRLLAGSGNLRRNTVFFCDASIEKPLKKILNNDRNENVKIVQSKYAAYFALSNSATNRVSYPRFCVIPDYEIKKMRKVDMVIDSSRDLIETMDVELPTNYFDGQGLISPKLSQMWAEELGLDFIPASYIIRANFIKGMVCTFDFHKFGKEVAHSNIITDVWGIKRNIEDIDLVLTESQFKLWSSYESLESYLASSHKNNLQFGISRVSPKHDKTVTLSNYQYLQVLDLPREEQIESLCKMTVDWLSNISQNDDDYGLLYLLGEMANNELEDDWFERIEDAVTKALILDRSTAKDPYIRAHIYHSLNKKIKESCLGALILSGNFSMMISDPYALAEHLFSMPIKGILNEREHYSNFWNNRGIDTVAAARSPLTHQSEMNILHLQDNEETEKWFSYIYSGIIYPAGGIDNLLHADSDQDGDLVMTTNQREFIEGAQGGLPISYFKKVAEKVIINDDRLWISDSAGMNSRVGFITNLSSTYHCLLNNFEKGSPENDAIEKRLKLLRFHQGQEIDKQKGIVIDPFPDHWAKWTRKKDTMTQEEMETADFNNKILADKRPYFMRYLYDSYNAQYRKFLATYENYCIAKFGMHVDELMAYPEKTKEQIETLDKFHRYNPLLMTGSVMNRISWHMEGKVKELRESFQSIDFDFSLYLDKDIEEDEEKIQKMIILFDEYKSYKKRRSISPDVFENMNQYIIEMSRKAHATISSYEPELANLAVAVCYRINPKSNKDFCWKLFSDGIMSNIVKNGGGVVSIPVLCDYGDIEYLGRKYRRVQIDIKDNI